MTVHLESSVRRFIGLSTDEKPYPGWYDRDAGGEVREADLPAGSTFKEADTGHVYSWNGKSWDFGDSPEVLELREIRGLLAVIADRLPPAGL